jgi:hypothetical protein
MERGLLWLPLLFLFIWLVWSGNREYLKVKFYQSWAEQFEQAKYDIYSVLGKKGDLITWGKPTPKGIVNQSTFSLQQIKEINLLIKNQVVSVDNVPTKGEASLQFLLSDNTVIDIPFTDVDLTVKWLNYLQKLI